MLTTRFQLTISTCYNRSQKVLTGIHVHLSLVLKKIIFSQLYRHMASPGSSFLQGALSQKGQHQSVSHGKQRGAPDCTMGKPWPGPTYICGNGSAARQTCLGLTTALLTHKLMSCPHSHDHPGAAQP